MTDQASIIFFPQLRYLSNPTFFAIADQLKDYRTIYLDTSNYSPNAATISPEERIELEEHFDEIVELGTDIDINRFKGRLKDIRTYRHLINELKSHFSQKNYKAVIMPSDIAFEIRAFGDHLPHIKRIVLQPGFRRILGYLKYPFIHKLKYWIYRYLLRVPLLRKTPMYGMQDKEAHYIFWTDKWRASVWNPVGLKHYILNGVPSVRTITAATGKKEIAGLESFVQDQPTILILLNKRTSIGNQAFEKYARCYKEFIKRNPEANVILRIHPQEDIQYCRSLYKEILNDKVVLIANELSFDLSYQFQIW